MNRVMWSSIWFGIGAGVATALWAIDSTDVLRRFGKDEARSAIPQVEQPHPDMPSKLVTTPESSPLVDAPVLSRSTTDAASADRSPSAVRSESVEKLITSGRDAFERNDYDGAIE